MSEDLNTIDDKKKGRRILYILPSINARTGGPARSIPRQIQALSRLGYDITLFTTNWPDKPPAKLPEALDDIRVEIFPTAVLPGLGHVPYSRELIGALRVAKNDFDYFHACSLWNPLISHAIAVLRRAGRPYAITCHGMLDPLVFRRKALGKWLWGRLIERENVESASFLHFMSEGEATKAASCRWRLPPTVIVPVNVDLGTSVNAPPRQEIEARYPVLVGKDVVLFVGRIDWVKNLDVLIDAVGLLLSRGRNLILMCVGPDNDGHQAQLVDRASRLGVADRVLFTGMFTGRDLQAAYSRADVVALISRKENFGQAAAEALVAGVPIVLSEGVDMGTGWPEPPVWRVPSTAAPVSEALLQALDFSRTCGAPCAAARALAESEWSNSKVTRLTAAYEKMFKLDIS